MKAKGNQKTKVNIVTLGCSKNLVDSENLLTQLRGNGIDAEHESKNDNSNVVVINTCGFIDNAKQESIDTILRYIDAKENGLVDKIYVSGCLSQRYKDDMEREMPQVDAFFGSNELPAILKKFKADYKHELVGERLLTTPSHYAYMKIAEGCDRPCSFCAIPVMRGKHVSLPMEDLVKQAKNMAAKGTKELILIAQDLTYYGLDIYKKRNLSDLLRNLSDVEGIDWIRLQYAYPSGFPLDILDVMAERSNICKYIDMPLQHASSNMLKLMRRGIDRPKTEDLIKTIRDKVPDIAFRTTMIIGHPGETEKDFDELCSFVEEQRFDRLGAFTYSHEEHTHSYTMEDSIPQEEKEERQATIMAIQEGISAEMNEKKIGNTYKVLFDRKEGGYFIGRTEHDSPEVDNEVMVSAKDQYVRIGDFANVKINDAAEFDLFGDIVK
ncbi:MAG: 30S ribosomal protein S12 methylthiotransferase RimO [Cytophaga sp.]|uniref:30S ribosomal protein S12 methylthiotransferase RimO n=1 Tax=Cytophaga sp. TaxID=29535 RepID=UPI003F7F3943